MMVIKDLAERWGVSIQQAKSMVRDMKVPFIALREFDLKVDWRFIRFDPDAVSSWERSRERMFPTVAAATKAPAFVVGRRLRRS